MLASLFKTFLLMLFLQIYKTGGTQTIAVLLEDIISFFLA